MECHYCHINTRKFYCSRCIQQKLTRSHEEEIVVIKQRDELLEQAEDILKKATVVQLVLAEKSKRMTELEYLKEQQKIISKRCSSKSKIIIELKKQLEHTQKVLNETMSRKQEQISNDKCYRIQLKNKTKSWQQIHKQTIVTRRVLVDEVMSLFEIKKKSKDVYICGQTLPINSLVELPKYPKEMLNAAVDLVIQIILLITSYLGIELPFYISRKGLHYRIELIKSNVAIHLRKKKNHIYLFLGQGEKNYKKFVRGMTMLNYNVAYLCHTQGIEIPLDQVTHTMQNLVACLNSSLKLGIRSHALHFQGIRGLDFSLDFKQVMQLTQQGYKYHPPSPQDIEEKISELDLNDHYFSSSNSKIHLKEQQQQLEYSEEDDELYSDSDSDRSDNDSDEKDDGDDTKMSKQYENWNLVDVMTSFGSNNDEDNLESTTESTGESIFQLGASMIPGVMNMMNGGRSQQSRDHISNYLYRRRARS